MPARVERIAARDEYGQPSAVEVVVYRRGVVDRTETVRVGDKFRVRTDSARGRIMRVAVTSFWGNGEKAFVKRSTSRRRQAIKTTRLVMEYDRA